MEVCRPILIDNNPNNKEGEIIFQHNYVFVTSIGTPLDENTFHTFFSRQMEKRIGIKRIGPLQIRISFVTNMYDHGITEQEEDAIATMMQTSVKMLRDVYD